MFREYCRPIGEANQTNLGTVSKPISPQFYRVKARKDVIRPLATGGLPMLFAGHRLNLRIEFAAGARLDEPRGVGSKPGDCSQADVSGASRKFVRRRRRWVTG